MIYLSFLANKGKFIGKLKCRIKNILNIYVKKLNLLRLNFNCLQKIHNFCWWNTIHHKVWTIRFILKISFFTFICQLKIQKCTFRMQKRIFWLYKWVIIILQQRPPIKADTLWFFCGLYLMFNFVTKNELIFIAYKWLLDYLCKTQMFFRCK